jgi:regulator of nucleoside diphosphate kinase
MKDYAILEALLKAAAMWSDPVASLIQVKLSNAAIVGTDDIDPRLVTLNSRVVFGVDSGPTDTRIVINGDENGLVGMTIPIRVPRGLALLGARAGHNLVPTRLDGSVEDIRVEEVAFQPETHRWNEAANGRSLKATTRLNALNKVASPGRGAPVRPLRVVRVSDEFDPGPSSA